jgi:hypothetical protein
LSRVPCSPTRRAFRMCDSLTLMHGRRRSSTSRRALRLMSATAGRCRHDAVARGQVDRLGHRGWRVRPRSLADVPRVGAEAAGPVLGPGSPRVRGRRARSSSRRRPACVRRTRPGIWAPSMSSARSRRAENDRARAHRAAHEPSSRPGHTCLGGGRKFGELIDRGICNVNATGELPGRCGGSLAYPEGHERRGSASGVVASTSACSA